VRDRRRTPGPWATGTSAGIRGQGRGLSAAGSNMRRGVREGKGMGEAKAPLPPPLAESDFGVHSLLTR
jgi:hypothetical protein